MNSNIDKLIQLILESKHCVAFTGAGISTLAGIHDFRGKNGLYTQPNTQQMFDIQVFDKNPEVYYSIAKDFIYGLDEKKPAIVHTVLAQLEKKGILKAIITQNIDLLHQKAGSKNVLEIHGSPTIHECRSCGKQVKFESIVSTAKKGIVPKCQCGGVIKPNITFFGESLPLQTLIKAEEEAKATDLMLVLGSSLTVYPAASLPEYAIRNKSKIVIVNEQETHLDDYATLKFSDLQNTFEYINKKTI